MKEELNIKVEITEFKEVKGHGRNARMISFGGECDCENFKGKILSGGVDTQKDITGSPSSLSARYMLEGIDKAGKECKIFIENNGLWTQEDMKTTPMIITDSEALAYLETTPLTGTIEGWEKGVIIHIFSEAD